MEPGVCWRWQRERYYRDHLFGASGVPRELVKTLPSLPFRPVEFFFSTALISLIEGSPDPLGLCLADVVHSTPREFEFFLGRFAGTDLEKTLLLDFWAIPVVGKQGSRLRIPVIMSWCEDMVTVVIPRELALDEKFYVDRLLLLTELNHGCRDV